MMRHKLIPFAIACFIGMLLALLYHWHQSVYGMQVIYLTQPLPDNNDVYYLKWLNQQDLHRTEITDVENFYYVKNKTYHLESDELVKKISVLCLIISKSSKRVKAINSTWVKHCNHHFFVGNFPKNLITTLKVIKTSGQTNFEVMCSVIHDITKDVQNYNWILIVEDKAFAIVENLRYFVASYSSKDIHYFGHAVKDDFSGISYNLASAGIVLSSGAASYLHHSTPPNCKTNISNYMYDMALGEILGRAHVHPIDTRDHHGRCRFNSFNMETALAPGGTDLSSPYWKQSLYLSYTGRSCCSDSAVTFNNVAIKKMFFTYYLIYKIHPMRTGSGVGNIKKSDKINSKTSSKNIQKPGNLSVDLIDDDEGGTKINKGFVSLVHKKSKKKEPKNDKKA
ncbi:Glycoprotein-N-acetylgalactosamine 3-beta-galactosyltransferase 1 [Nymphon striatum]|nr:Glycoprotein-N-acetylgalactosamine 3-beta-galactosyltransferase 1 [Nymphon striatum]